MRNLFRIFRRSEDGIAYVEFAIAIPFLLALFMGAVEVTRYIIIAQKLEKATVTVSDVVAQASSVNTTYLGNVVQAAEQIMMPYTFGSNGYVIITSVSRIGSAQPTVNWQYSGGGTWTQSSQIGFSGGAAVLPNGFTLNANENVIVAEIYYNYSPLMLGSVLSSGQMYKVAVFRPRLGELLTLGS